MWSVFRLTIRNVRASMDMHFLAIQFVLPLMFLYIGGLAYGGLIPSLRLAGVETRYTSYIATGILAVSAMTASIVSGTMLWLDRRYGMLDQILSGPFARSEYALSILVSTLISGATNAFIIGVLSIPIAGFYTLTPMGLLAAAAGILLTALVFGALGIIISSMVRSSEVFTASMNLVMFLFVFLSDVFYPAESAPPPLKFILSINPLTFATDLIRWGLLGVRRGSIQLEVLALILLGAAMAYGSSRALKKILA